MKRTLPTPLARAPRGLLAAIAMLAGLAPAALAQLEAPAPASAEPVPAESSLVAPDTSPAAEVIADRDSTTAASGLAGPTVNPRFHAVRKVRLAGQGPFVARTGPGDRYAIAGVFPGGATFAVVAKNGDWYGVRLTASETGWLHATFCREFDDLSDLEFRPNPRAFSRVGSYVLNGYAGAYAFDRKSNTLVLGGRVGYYVFDRLQAEAGLGWTHVRRPAEIVESLFGLTLEAEDFHMLFYHLNVTWEILPGRQMVPFLTAGVGSAIMRGETEPSVNFGAGTTLFLSKRTALRWEFRDHRFQSGPDGARVTNDNIEFTLGTVLLF